MFFYCWSFSFLSHLAVLPQHLVLTCHDLCSHPRAAQMEISWLVWVPPWQILIWKYHLHHCGAKLANFLYWRNPVFFISAMPMEDVTSWVCPHFFPPASPWFELSSCLDWRFFGEKVLSLLKKAATQRNENFLPMKMKDCLVLSSVATESW